VDSLGHNASGFSGLLPEIRLEPHGQIVQGGQVPEPQTWELVAAGEAIVTTGTRTHRGRGRVGRNKGGRIVGDGLFFTRIVDHPRVRSLTMGR